MNIFKKLLNKISGNIVNIKAKRINNKAESYWRTHLKENNFSIICSSCIGGVIYNRLGKQFLSPTINLFFTQSDFIKFSVNLKYYLSLDLKFIKTDKVYPVAMLDDITIHFNHSKSEFDAANDWNRRKKRINFDNIYLIFYYREGYSIEQIREIEKANYKRVILLSYKDLDLDYSYKIESDSDEPANDNFLTKDKYGLRTFERKWDFVSWLNGD